MKLRVTTRQADFRESFPDAVQLWVIYCTALSYGAADAALTLVLHNLGREARILARQIFEYSAKAWYFKRHPRAAKRELESEPFRELYLLEDLGYDKRASRFRGINKLCNALNRARPALATYARKTRDRTPPTTKGLLGRKGRRTRETYALHYRIRSQTVHATVLGMRDVVTELGIAFDSREPEPNLTLLDICRYLLTLLRLLNDVLKLKAEYKIESLVSAFAAIEKSLVPKRGPNAGGIR